MIPSLGTTAHIASEPVPDFLSRLTFAISTLICGLLTFVSLTPPSAYLRDSKPAIQPPASRDQQTGESSSLSHSKPSKRTHHSNGNALPTEAPPKPAIPTSPTPAPADFSTLFNGRLYLVLAAYRTLLLALYTAQALLILLPSLPSSLSALPPHPLNPTLLTWNPTSIPVHLTIQLSALFRLLCFRTLGASFTFNLTAPQRLVTTGVYAWLQHPSYTGLIPGSLASATWIWRGDGVLGCLLPAAVLRYQDEGLLPLPRWAAAALGRQSIGWNQGVAVGVAAALALGSWRRITQEERWLERCFGDEWRAWHKTTARVVPGVF